jgi:DNA-binding XRE family transcriptional regulator
VRSQLRSLFLKASIQAIAARADEKAYHDMRLSVCHTFVGGRSERPRSTLCLMRSTRTLQALANRIKELRDEKDISQEELAHRSGLSRTGMGFLETGKRWPRLDTLMSVLPRVNQDCLSTAPSVERVRQARVEITLSRVVVSSEGWMNINCGYRGGTFPGCT